MNTTPKTEQKERVLKMLAIGGLLGLLIIIGWLGIMLVRVMPNAFTSLASLADSVYNYQPVELIVVSSEEIVNSGDSVSLSWNDPKPAGTFSFTYGCTDGVAIDVATTDGTESAECDVPFELGDVTSITMTIEAERDRFTDIPYTLAFTTPRSISDVATADGIISVVNASIGTPDTEATTTPVVTPTPTTPTPTPAPAPAPAPATTTKPAAVKPTNPKPTYVQTPTYAIPVSNPKGTVDLAIRSLGAGTIVNGTFVNTGTITDNNDSAIQFEIKNIGTKTSSSFTYTATLPNGTSYTSPTQTALKPNERTVVTLGFIMSNTSGVAPFNATVKVSGDTNTINNTFTSAVTVR